MMFNYTLGESFSCHNLNSMFKFNDFMISESLERDLTKLMVSSMTLFIFERYKYNCQFGHTMDKKSLWSEGSNEN